MREFSGPCSCQTLEQKWRRYVDWVQKSGGYIHEWIEFKYVNDYQHINALNEDDGTFKMHSHERGMFVNVDEKYRRKVKAKSVLLQIPFSIAFSQFMISKYIKNTTHPLSKLNNPKLKQLLFPKPDHFMPDQFPDWDEFRKRSIRIYGMDTIRGWLALGLAWLKEYTLELLPWLQLLPKPYYLPILWDKAQRDQVLLAGTKALKIVQHLEREYQTATPYIDMLGLTEIQVKEAFGWISSRSFGMNLYDIGGAKKSPVIPCGIDFFNHNIFAESSLYYDHTFGQNRFEYHGTMQNQEIIENLVLNNQINKDGMIKEIDFASNYLWVNQDTMNETEIFVNYGKYHTSASRMALFGFIDDIHPYDHYSVNLDLLLNDPHFDIKRTYFKTVWNSSYTQQNKTKQIQEQKMCFSKHDTSTWHGLGGSPRYYQNMITSNKYNKKEEQRIYGPPLSMEYYGQKTIKVHGNFLRFLRLAYLPRKYFDSFTISAIINDFEYDYLENIIDPFIRNTLNNICIALLKQYPTTYFYDQLQLTQIDHDRRNILKELQLNRNKNLTETQRLTQILTELDRNYIALKYKVREKGFLDKCSRLTFEATNKYLQSVKRRKKKHGLRKRKKKIITTDGLQQLLQTTFDFTLYPIIDYNNNSNISNISNVNGSNNVSVEGGSNTVEYEIDYVELLRQIENALLGLGIDIDVDIDIFDEGLWSNIIDDATESILSNTNNRNNNVDGNCDDGDDDDDEMLDDGDQIDGELNENEDERQIQNENEQEIVENTPSVVSKKNLVIGEPKKPKKEFMAETIGWNSPKAGVNKGGKNRKQQQQTISFANINGQPLDLSTLFGGNGGSTSFTINGGNIQINNGQIIIGNNAQIGSNNNLNNLLTQFGLNSGNNDNNNNDNNNALQTVGNDGNDNNEEIPETVPFSQLMNSATVSVFGLDGNGNLVNVGNAMNNINLAQLFNNNRKKNKPKPKPKP